MSSCQGLFIGLRFFPGILHRKAGSLEFYRTIIFLVITNIVTAKAANAARDNTCQICSGIANNFELNSSKIVTAQKHPKIIIWGIPIPFAPKRTPSAPNSKCRARELPMIAEAAEKRERYLRSVRLGSSGCRLLYKLISPSFVLNMNSDRPYRAEFAAQSDSPAKN